MAPITGIIKNSLIAAIKVYRLCISGFLGPCCRFEPTCSVYAIDAIKQHGCARGSLIGMRRLLSCHPWHRGGFDPVPKAKK
jgi:putative membrane protein insertion efficiency factor